MYVIQHVSVWACCHAQAVCLKPPTRVKPWFYRASKREIGCSTALLLLLLLLSTPSLSDVPRSVCCRWFKDKCDTLCLWNHWNGVSFLTNLAAKSDSHLQKKNVLFLSFNSVLNLKSATRKSSKGESRKNRLNNLKCHLKQMGSYRSWFFFFLPI